MPGKGNADSDSRNILFTQPLRGVDTVDYSNEFYEAQRSKQLNSSMEIVDILCSLFDIKSVVDVGCGSGGFLYEFMRRGIIEVLGIDGHWIKDSDIVIPPTNFARYDITEKFTIPRRFDIALCLEVGEHLKPENAPILVENLTRLSEIVVFSAAIPCQGGTHHVNEQWPEYWCKLFRLHDYDWVDCIRPKIWTSTHVDFVYKQNTIIYTTHENKMRIQSSFQFNRQGNSDDSCPLALVHPSLFLSYARPRNPVFRKAYNLARSIWSRIKESGEL